MFMTFFNYKQCFKNENKAVVFVYFFVFFLQLLTLQLKLQFPILLSEIYEPSYLSKELNITLYIGKNAVMTKTLTFTNKYLVT